MSAARTSVAPALHNLGTQGWGRYPRVAADSLPSKGQIPANPPDLQGPTQVKGQNKKRLQRPIFRSQKLDIDLMSCRPGVAGVLKHSGDTEEYGHPEVGGWRHHK